MRGVKVAAVGDCGGEGGQLYRSHAESVTVTGHNPGLLLPFFGQESVAFKLIVDSGPRAESEILGVLHHAIIAEHPPQDLKNLTDALARSNNQVHAVAGRNPDILVRIEDAF